LALILIRFGVYKLTLALPHNLDTGPEAFA
jgi:hypothetical protein